MSTNSLNPGFGVTADDIRAYDWQAVVDGAPSRECQAYCDALGKQAAALKEAGDDHGSTIKYDHPARGNRGHVALRAVDAHVAG